VIGQEMFFQQVTLLICIAAVVTEVKPIVYHGKFVLPLVVLQLAAWGVSTKMPTEQFLLHEVFVARMALVTAAYNCPI